MQQVILKRDPKFNEKDFFKRSAVESDYDTLIKEDSILYDEKT
jgi:hypothetical protein